MRISWSEKKSNEEEIEMAYTKDRFSKPPEKDNSNFGAYKQSSWTRKGNIDWKDFLVPKTEEDKAQNTQTV